MACRWLYPPSPHTLLPGIKPFQMSRLQGVNVSLYLILNDLRLNIGKHGGYEKGIEDGDEGQGRAYPPFSTAFANHFFTHFNPLFL